MSISILARQLLLDKSFIKAVNTIGLSWSHPQTDNASFLRQVQSDKPRFAIITSDYANQPYLFTNLRQNSPDTRIVLCVLSDAPISTELWPLLESLTIDVVCLLSELNKCLQTLINGQLYVSALLATHPVCIEKEPFPNWHELTQGELRVLRLLTEGKSGPQIAAQLYISPKTVDNHKYKISQKLIVSGGPGSLIKFVLLNREKLLATPELAYIK